MDRPYRRVSLLLPSEDFDTLQALAEREDRTLREQATYLVRRSLATKGADSCPANSTHTGDGRA